MKSIVWLGNTLKEIRSYPDKVKKEIGYNIEKLQYGGEPVDFKPMVSIGSGVNEIRIHASNEYRVIYVAKFKEHIYILHSFIKKTQKTGQRDIDKAKDRYKDVLNMRGNLK